MNDLLILDVTMFENAFSEGNRFGISKIIQKNPQQSDDWNIPLGDHPITPDELAQFKIDMWNDRWNCALVGACYGGHHDLVDLVIQKGGDQLSWNTGLTSACQGGNFDIVLLMIQNGANVWNNGLRYACMEGRQNRNVTAHRNLVELMIEKGANKLEWGFYQACQ